MTGLSDFIQQYVTPYDPDSDTYRRPPFAQPVKAGKNSPIYNAHSYHTKVPPEGIVPYIEHYTDPGDLILDPFCGSGMTGVAALLTGRHAILNDLSPAAVHIARNYTTPVEQRVIEQVADFLAANPSPEQRSLQYLWNHVLYKMLREGSVEVSMAKVEEMLTYHYQTFKLVDGRYYLRGEAVFGGNIFDLSSDAGAIAWLNALLGNEPQTTGDLIPQWQQETASISNGDPGRLDRLLEQNFWQDRRTGRWRVPTPAEREQMSARADLSAQAHLRMVRRYLEGELDRQPNDRELAAWLRFCYNREFFSEAAQLFPRINESRLEPDEYKTIKRMATVSKIRAGESRYS
jgi:hypothetical protein